MTLHTQVCDNCDGQVTNQQGVPRCEQCGAVQYSQSFGQSNQRLDTTTDGLKRRDRQATDIDKSARRHDQSADPDTPNSTTFYCQEPDGKPAKDAHGVPISEAKARDMERRWRFQAGDRSGANTRHKEWRRWAESLVNSLDYPSHVAERVGELAATWDMRGPENKCRHKDCDALTWLVVGLIGWVVWGTVDRALSSFNRHGKSLLDNPKVLAALSENFNGSNCRENVAEAVSYVNEKLTAQKQQRPSAERNDTTRAAGATPN